MNVYTTITSRERYVVVTRINPDSERYEVFDRVRGKAVAGFFDRIEEAKKVAREANSAPTA